MVHFETPGTGGGGGGGGLLKAVPITDSTAPHTQNRGLFMARKM